MFCLFNNVKSDPKHEIFFPFLEFVSTMICSFQSIKFDVTFVQFIPKYFVHFHLMVNGIVFLTSFSDYSLQVYKNKVISVYSSCTVPPCLT